MSYFTWNKCKQPAGIVISFMMLAGIVSSTSCKTNRGYDPAPRAGAEYRFEDGLPKEKKPQYLFNKKERKDMAKMGYPIGTPNSAPRAEGGGGKKDEAAPAKAADGQKAARVDSLRMDTVYKVRPQ